MALIQVTPDLLTGKATELRGYASTHADEMQKIKTLVNGLNEVWKGDAQDAFVQKFESMQPTFNQFAEMLEGYAKLMDTAAKQLGDTDQALSQTMNSFGV